jgi:hypothetical protein
LLEEVNGERVPSQDNERYGAVGANWTADLLEASRSLKAETILVAVINAIVSVD